MPLRSASRDALASTVIPSQPRGGSVRIIRKAATGLALGVGAGVVTGLLQRPAPATKPERPGAF